MHRIKNMVQVVVISSINQKSGKTLLTAHLSIMLAKEYKTAVFDGTNNSGLSDFIAKRHTLNLGKDYNLPIPDYKTLTKQNFETIENYDVVILDSPDSKYFCHADIFITPMRETDGISSLSSGGSLYASLIWEAKKQRAAKNKSAFKWVVVPNDEYNKEEYQILEKTSKLLGFSVAPYFTNRPEYEQGLKEGITVIDKDMPKLKTLFDLPDLYARRDLKKLTDFIWQKS